jgi:hypothetical protein
MPDASFDPENPDFESGPENEASSDDDDNLEAIPSSTSRRRVPFSSLN